MNPATRTPSSLVRVAVGAAAAAGAAALLAHAPRLGAPHATSALLALVGASAALAAAFRRFGEGDVVASLGAAAVFAAHPAHVGAIAAGAVAPFLAATAAFAAAALRRAPQAPAPPWRSDRRRLAETALYVLAAALDPRAAVAPVLVAATDAWFHPDAPPAWRRAQARTTAAQAAAAALVACVVARFDAAAGAIPAAAAAAIFGAGPEHGDGALRATALCVLLPAGVLFRRATGPKAVALAVGVFGAWAFLGALSAACGGVGTPPLAAAGVALAAPILAWRAATAATTPRAEDPWTESPIPSVPALRDVVRGGEGDDGAFARAAGAAVRAAFDEARRDLARSPDPRWERLLAADAATAPPDAEDRLRAYVRDALFPRLRAARRVLVVGAPPRPVAAALGERVEVFVRPDGLVVDGLLRGLPQVRVLAADAPDGDAAAAAAGRAPLFDAALSFRGADFERVDDAVRHVAGLRRLVRRDGPVALVALSRDDAPGPPAWDDPSEAVA